MKQEKQNAHLWDEQYPLTDTGKYHNGILMGKAKALGIPEGNNTKHLKLSLQILKEKLQK
ncbi:hypothetical protein AAFF39_03835 [Lactococcus garvieae]